MLFDSTHTAAIDSTRNAVLDSTRKAVLDTVGKTETEKKFIEKIASMHDVPPDQILTTMLDKVLLFGLKLLAALLIYAIGAWIIKIIKKSLRRFFERKKTEQAIASFTMSLVSTSLWVLLIIIAVGTLGIETTSLAALLAAGGMAIGMALSGTVQNFSGGIMILVFKPFKAGDYIEAQGYAGTVTEVNITATKIVTVDNKVIILPNGTLSNGIINNYSKMEWRRIEITVGVEYGSDADTVKKLLMEIAAADPRVGYVSDASASAAASLNPAATTSLKSAATTSLKSAATTSNKSAGAAQANCCKSGHPAPAPADPFAGLKTLNASSVDFTFRVWTRSADYWNAYFDLNEAIYKTLPAHGINFPFPQVTVHMGE